MTRFNTFLSLFVILFAGVLAGCESQAQFTDEDITLQAKNAVDVLPVSPDFVGMMNVDDMKDSALGAEIYEGLASEMMGELDGLFEATGFNPREDLEEIYVAVEELSDDTSPGVSVVAYVSMDPDRMADYIEERAGDEVRVREYRGIELYEVGDGEHEGGFSLANEDMILVSSRTDLLEDMVDRLIDEGEALSSNTQLMDLVARASSGKSGWMIAEKPRDMDKQANKSGNEMEDAAAQIFTAVDHLVVAMNADGGEIESQIFLYPNGSVSTDDLESLTKGMRSAMRAGTEMDSDAMKMLDDVRISSSREYVKVTFTADRQTMEMIRG